MQIIITGCGRAGTNLLLECVRASGQIHFTHAIEDRAFFKRNPKLAGDYGTKVAVEWDQFTTGAMATFMDANNNMKILFSFRHPYDVILSKVYRGRPKSQGGDNQTEDTAKDGTMEVASHYVQKSWQLFEALATRYGDRVVPVRMEDMILHTLKTVTYICARTKLTGANMMFEPWRFTRNAYHNSRYHHAPDKGEVDKWKDLTNSFDGYFYSHGLQGGTLKQLGDLNPILKEQAEYFHYKLL